MEKLYETYVTSIDPTNDYKVLLCKDIFSSIIFHVLSYFIAFKLLSLYILPIKFYSDKLLLISLSLIMTFGYLGRLSRSKAIYNYYLKNGYDKKQSRNLAMDQINKSYFTWYFLG